MFWDVVWDVGNVIYDVATCSWGDAVFDTGAALIPFVPAGSTKIVKFGDDINPNQLKKLDDNFIDILQKKGILNAHGEKDGYGSSKIDIFKDCQEEWPWL